jgi:DNA adenine methylase
MPPHKRYIEVFGGGLAIFYAKEKLTCKECIEIVNDFNSELINLHTQIKYRPQTLSLYLSRLLPSRELFFQIRDGILKPRNDIERAFFYLFLITYSFGGKQQSFAMAKGRKPKQLVRDFEVWSRRLKGVQIENLDFERLIKEYDHQESFFYLDPPYFKTEKYYKGGGFGKDDHVRLRDTLKNISGKFLLSYNDDSFIRELYEDFEIVEVQTNYSLNAKFRGNLKQELLIKNF